MPLHSVVDAGFAKTVLCSDKPVLVAFRAGWCLPSQQLVPIIEEVAAKFEGRVQVVAVDADGDTAAIRRHSKVNRLPITMLYHHGRSVDFIGGMTSVAEITDMIDRRLQPVIDLTELDFDAEVIQSNVPVLVHFASSSCAPSRELAPVVQEIAEKFGPSVRVTRVDFGPENARLCARFGVRRFPTLSLFINGQIEDQIFGAMVGGTKVDGVRASCVGLTSFQNIASMLAPFVA
jgi:thioredoxin 1